jgi:peptidoglycan/LPS O-acetylase OafA/YrhL
MNYRREIDGLRALAVLSVILFHAGVGIIPGGYVGVDVFFVISGYLITSIIVSEKACGTFSLLSFYERRVRRILPSLYVVIAMCIPVAWVYMQPNDMKDFCLSLIAVSTFSSNILFWRDQLGYSPDAAQLKPLLHTWSLAVEEQYYVFFPIFLLITWRVGKTRLVGVLFAVAFISLALAQWGAYNKPVATYLLLPTRAWELVIGSLLAFYLKEQQQEATPLPVREALSGGGMLLILYSVFTFSKSTPFPSLYALVPTMGAALLIMYATPRTFVGSLLSSRALVGIGLVSYSAYLWHQPLFAFARHIKFDSEPSLNVMLLLSVLSVVLAYLSWRFVELPARNVNVIGRRALFQSASAVAAVFIAFGVAGYLSNGFIYRYTPEEQELLASIDNDNVNKIMIEQGLSKCYLFNTQLSDLFDNTCLDPDTEKPRVVIFGDSHAAHLSSGVRYYFGNGGYRVDQWTMPGCSLFLLPRNKGNVGICRELYDKLIDQVVPGLKSRDILIISLNWTFGPTVATESELLLSWKEGLSRIRNTQASIVVIGASPAFTRPPQALAIRNKIDRQEEIYFETSSELASLNDRIEGVANGLGFIFINPLRYMCKAEDSKLCLVKKNGSYLYLDHAHLSESGSFILIRELWNIYDKKTMYKSR